GWFPSSPLLDLTSGTDIGTWKKPGAFAPGFSRSGLPAAIVVPVVVAARVVITPPAIIGVARRVVGRTVIIIAVRGVVRIGARGGCASDQRAGGKTEAKARSEVPRLGRRRRHHCGRTDQTDSGQSC